MRLIRRAVSVLARADGRAYRHDYIPLEVSHSRGRRRASVVYFQQRHLGLPVYDGRRSVVLGAGRAPRVTGQRIRVTELRSPFPRKSAEEAVRAAIVRVFRSRTKRTLEALAAPWGIERFASFEAKGLDAPLTAHLAVFVAGRSHLAWVVHGALPRGPTYEVLVDAASLRLLKQRTLSYHLDACLNLFSGAGVQASVPFRPAWSGDSTSRLSCSYESTAWTPPTASAGLICGSTPRDKRSLNAFCLASRGLDLLDAAGARMGTPTGAKLTVELFGGALADPSAAAIAFDDHFRLCAIGNGPTYRHAAYDPTVVLHEMSHIVLAFNLGGASYPAPFEAFGESGATAEGLADFLGLTLWNRIRRETTPQQPPTAVVGASFLPSPRDYSAFQNAPVPPAPASGSIHTDGMALCGALLFALSRLVATGVATEQQAEESLWRALCIGLQQSPHQGPLPLFCCAAEAVRRTIDAAHRSTITAAFTAAGLPGACPHWNP